MQTANTKSRSMKHVVLLDAALIAAACLLPVFSHVASFPLYQLNPMLFLLLAGMALVEERRNAYLIAVLLPVVSMLAVGMPAPAKACCMVAEYSVVVALFGLLSERCWSTFASILLAMLAGKICFYILKAVVMGPVVLVSTSVWLQLLVVAIGAAVFTAIKMLKK